MWSVAERPEKAQIRPYAVAPLRKGYISKVYSPLPSVELHDVIQGMAAGSLVPGNTFILAIEKNKKAAGIIRQKLSRMGFSHYVHNGQLHDLPLAEIVSVYNLPPVDHCFYDLCGQFTDRLAKWLRELPKYVGRQARFYGPLFAPGAKIAWTLSTNMRAAVQLGSVRHGAEIAKQMKNSCQISECNRDKVLCLLSALWKAMSNWKVIPQRARTYCDCRVPMLYVEGTIKTVQFGRGG